MTSATVPASAVLHTEQLSTIDSRLQSTNSSVSCIITELTLLYCGNSLPNIVF